MSLSIPVMLSLIHISAISAAQQGAKVILVEKSSFLGGDTMMAGGAFNAVDTVAQGERVLSEAQKHTMDSYLELSASDEAQMCIRDRP